MNTAQLQQEIVRLRRKVTQLTSLLRLALVILQISRFSFARARLVDGSDRKRLIRAIQGTRSHFPLRTILRGIGLSHDRYHEWNRDDRCDLDDRLSCPKMLPHQLTQHEVDTIRDMVTSEEY